MKTIIRILVILALGFVAFFGIFCTPLDSLNDWFMAFLLSKALGILAVVGLVKFWRQCVKRDLNFYNFQQNLNNY